MTSETDYTHLFGGCEDLQAHQLPWEEFNYATFIVGDMFEVYGFFQPNGDGWTYLPRGPRTTVDLQHGMWEGDWETWDYELGTTPGLTKRLLDAAKERGPKTTA